jgi:hypothetical protein
MAWHKFTEEDQYRREDVVSACKKHINDGKVKNKKEKWLRLKQISECAHPIIRYSPQGKGGWGKSPLNPHNWQTPKGKPIL